MPQRSRSRLSSAPFNLFQRGGIYGFSARQPRLYTPVQTVILVQQDSRVLETGNGIKMWSEPQHCQIIIFISYGGGEMQVELPFYLFIFFSAICVSPTSAAGDKLELTCWADVSVAKACCFTTSLWQTTCGCCLSLLTNEHTKRFQLSAPARAAHFHVGVRLNFFILIQFGFSPTGGNATFPISLTFLLPGSSKPASTRFSTSSATTQRPGEELCLHPLMNHPGCPL